MNFMNAMTLLTVPRLSVIIRKSYGRAYVCMGGGRHSDDVAAWPTAEISFMSPDFATMIVHGVKPASPGSRRSSLTSSRRATSGGWRPCSRPRR
jgi:acetyl-CoA carboxylase carboxyltransferase component